MLGYITLGTNNFAESLEFYDQLFAVCGGKRLMELDTFVLWGTSFEQASVAIAKPFDGNPATVGNGVMAGLQMDSRESVDAMYAKAMELGAADEGAPGDRGGNFYAGYFRDPDGNKLNAFFMG